MLQIYQACKGSILNHSHGIVFQMPTSEYIQSQTTEATNINKMGKKHRVGRCIDSSQDTPKDSDKLQTNNDSRIALI